MNKHTLAVASTALMALACLTVTPAQARVTKIIIDETLPLAADASGGVAFERIAGRAFGELDPRAPGNAIIQDIELCKDADGRSVMWQP